VVAPVAGEERDAPAGDLADGHGGGRRPEGSVDDDLFDVVEQGVEAGAAVHADVGAPARSGGAHDDETDDDVVEPLSLFVDEDDEDEDDPPSPDEPDESEDAPDDEPEPPSPDAPDDEEPEPDDDEPERLSVL
jgi:hypothetical protein